VYILKRSYLAGEDGRELVESYPVLGYTRFFLPRTFYRRYDMPSPWPWALHPLAQAPFNATAIPSPATRETADRLLDRYPCRRRETWWRNEMGEKQSHFKAAEHFRR
jgi:hypothetical protein